MQVKIYHCHDRYGPVISLTEVFKFEISETEMDFCYKKPIDHKEVLEYVFTILNRDSGIMQASISLPYFAQNRSICVADVVVLGEVAFHCDSNGWSSFPTDELVKAIEEGKKRNYVY
jgi:hypothetical protein